MLRSCPKDRNLALCSLIIVGVKQGKPKQKLRGISIFSFWYVEINIEIYEINKMVISSMKLTG